MNEVDDSNSEDPYDPLLDESEADDSPELMNGPQYRFLGESLPGAVPSPHSNRRMPSRAVPASTPSVFDPLTFYALVERGDRRPDLSAVGSKGGTARLRRPELVRRREDVPRGAFL